MPEPPPEPPTAPDAKPDDENQDNEPQDRDVEAAGDEGQAGAPSQPDPPTVQLSEEQCLSMLDEGKKLLNEDSFDDAVDLFAKVLESRCNKFGELGLECANVYYLYGRTLFFKAQAETDVLGGRLQGGTAVSILAVPVPDPRSERLTRPLQAPPQTEGAEGEAEEESDLEQ
eukprot:scaffold2052_cov177-Prasinococcus_capsulatus_cf.AAC.1